jgi:hypothetical protein
MSADKKEIYVNSDYDLDHKIIIDSDQLRLLSDLITMQKNCSSALERWLQNNNCDGWINSEKVTTLKNFKIVRK